MDYGRPDMAYYSFLDNLRKNQPIKIFNNGNMKRDLHILMMLLKE